MKSAKVLLCAAVVTLPLACKGGVVNYPDRASVIDAQKKWCAAMAKYEPEKGTTWLHKSDCERAIPSGSGPFVAAMAACYTRQHQEYEQVPDLGTLVANCTEEILVKAAPGNVSDSDLVLARCQRQNKCAKTPIDECKSAFNRINGTAKALLTSMYNLEAQAKIAACLRDAECGKDDQQAQDACYRPLHDARVWLPLSLATDSGLRPRPAE